MIALVKVSVDSRHKVDCRYRHSPEIDCLEKKTLSLLFHHFNPSYIYLETILVRTLPDDDPPVDARRFEAEFLYHVA